VSPCSNVPRSVPYLICRTHIRFLRSSVSRSEGIYPRGRISFFFQVKDWGKVERLIKSDIVGCFDNIDHGLLISFLSSYLGTENKEFCDLIQTFLTTPILDKAWKDYSHIKTKAFHKDVLCLPS